MSSSSKEIINGVKEIGKEIFTSLSGPVGFIIDSYYLYDSISKLKEGKFVELGCQHAGNSIGKKVGNVFGGFVGTILCPGGGTVVGCTLGGMIGSYIGGKGLKFLGENINNL